MDMVLPFSNTSSQWPSESIEFLPLEVSISRLMQFISVFIISTSSRVRAYCLISDNIDAAVRLYL
jgi:hypothetical protein